MSIDPIFIVYVSLNGTPTAMPTLFTAIITGLFALVTGLSVAWMTWRLALKRERGTFQREDQLRAFKETEQRYLSLLAGLEKSKWHVVHDTDPSQAIEEQAQWTATASLFASASVIEKLDDVRQTFEAWADEVRQSRPLKVQGTSMAFFSNINLEHREKARASYPAFRDAMVELTRTMKAELEKLRTEAQNVK